MSEADIAERGWPTRGRRHHLARGGGFVPSLGAVPNSRYARIQQTVVPNSSFRAACRLGLRPSAEGSYDAAIRAFERAASIDPNASAARDGLEQVRQAQLKQQIQSLFIDAQKAETAGRWREAKTVYETARSLAPNLNDLMARIEAINARIELATALTQILEDPARLQSDAELNQARALAITISQLPPPRW